MEIGSKEYMKLKLAACFRMILKEKKAVVLENKAKDIEDLKLVNSMRQLEADSGLSFTIIQRTCSANRDAQFTSLIKMIEGLDLTLTDFAILYDRISQVEMLNTKAEIENDKRPRIKKI